MSQHRRRVVAWVCAVAIALLALGAPLHGVAHALQVAQGAAHQDPASAHAHACEQCLQFAACDGAAPTAVPPAATPERGHDPVPACRPAAAPRGIAFTAYASRAPPRLG